MGKKSKQKKTKDGAETAKESRINAVQSDPIFHEMPRREKKVKVDSRFKAMFDDERFASTTATVDRHGRPVNKLKSREDLRNLYEFDESESSDNDKKQEEARVLVEKLQKKKKLDFARGEGNVSSSSDEDASDSEIVNEGEEEDNLNVHERWGELDHDVRKVEWTSRRLAVCNLDWDKMTAEDIFVALESFKPENGSLKSVHVYLSDFGAEQLKYEEEHGPRLADAKNNAVGDEDSDDGDGAAKPEVIRAYQFDRYRLYYAVVECDSDETANVIYESCDGIQYQGSGLTLDLRFIPDDMDFDATRLRDQCSPSSVNLRKYKPSHFQSDITRSSAKLDWDNSDFHRKKKVHRAFDDEANLDDLGELVASGSDDDEAGNDDATNFLMSAASIDTRNDVMRKFNGGAFDEQSDVEEEPKPTKRKSKEKKKLVTKKKRKLAESATNLPANLDDSRFDSLYSSADFAIDKTNPHYKGGVLADRQVQEKIRRKK